MSQGFINRPGTQLMATIRDGWRAKFPDSDTLVLAHPLHEPYITKLADIKRGDTLPPESHFDGEVNG